MIKGEAKMFEIANDIIIQSYVNMPLTTPCPFFIEKIVKYLNLNLEFCNFFRGSMEGEFILEKKLIRIKEKVQYRRQSFIIARGIGHFLLHKDKVNEIEPIRVVLPPAFGYLNKSEIEKTADLFGCVLLSAMDEFNSYDIQTSN